jgi:hypothetical protein
LAIQHQGQGTSRQEWTSIGRFRVPWPLTVLTLSPCHRGLNVALSPPMRPVAT